MGNEGDIADVCVVGAGPAGLAVALRCRSRGLSVILLEAGGEKPRPGPANGAMAVNAAHAPPEIASCTGLGGTAWWWGGRCVPFDPIDFEPRPYIPGSGWPLSYGQLAGWMREAAMFLGCDPDIVPEPLATESAASAPALEGWSRDPRLSVQRASLTSSGVDIRLGYTVSTLEHDGQMVTGVVARSMDGLRTIKAHQVVLACGGLETTRLLLQMQMGSRGLFGGTDGPLGRYYMGHLSGKIATIQFARSSTVNDFDFSLRSSGCFRRRRLSIPADAQRREGLPNIVFWPDNPPFHDPAHGSGTLSLVYLGLSVPFIGRLVLPEAIRRIHAASGGRVRPHIANVARNPFRTLWEMVSVVRQRLLGRPRRPGFLVRNPQSLYGLHYHAEQMPLRESRVRLSASGAERTPVLQVDLRHTEHEAKAVLRAHEILDLSLRARGDGRLLYAGPRDHLLTRILEQAGDGFHQLGTTRMGADPLTSVVDSGCRTHDLNNLFLASSSVFPTSGQANPTLLIVALALRLADQLGSKQVMKTVAGANSGPCSASI